MPSPFHNLPTRITLVFILFCGNLFGEDLSHLVTKEVREDWIEAFDVSKLEVPTNASGSVDYLLTDIQHHLEEDAYYHHLATYIVSEAGMEEYSQLTFSFQPEYQTLQLNELRLIRDGKVLDRLADTEVQILQQESGIDEQLYDGSRTAHLILKDVRKGDLLTYAYTLKGQNPVFEGHVHNFAKLGYSSQVRHCLRSVLWDADKRKLNWQIIGHKAEKRPQPTIQDSGPQLQVLKFEEIDTPRYPSENNVPSWHLAIPWLEYSDYESWEEFGLWARGLFSQEGELTEELKEVCDQLKMGSDSEEELVVATLRWVQRNIRYLGSFMGSHTHEPYPLATIDERRFGDCKDQGTLTAAMLAYLGFDATPALVNTSRWDSMEKYLIGHSSFDHLIVHLRLNDEDYWLDPTYTFQGGPLETLHSTYIRYAFVTKEGETSLRVVEPRGVDVDHTTMIDKFEIRNMTGSTAYIVETIYSGGDANSVRRSFATNSLDSIAEDYLKYYEGHYKGIKVAEPLVYSDDLDANIFKVRESYEIPKIFTVDEDNENRNKASFSGLLLLDKLSVPSEQERTMPYYVAYPRKLRHEIQIALPEEWNVSESFDQIENPAFTASARASYSDQKLNLTYTYEAQARSISPEDFDQYRSHVNEARNELYYSIYYDNESEAIEPEAPEEQAEPNSAIGYMLWGTGLSLGSLCAIACSLLAFFFWNPNERTPNSTSYVGIGGWLILPVIGLVLGPFIYAYQTLSFFTPLDEMAGYLTNEEVFIGFRLYYATGAFVGSFGFVLSLLCLVFLFSKRTAFPYLFIITLIFNLVSLVLIFVLEEALPDLDKEPDLQALPRTIISTLIWASYMLRSDRIKATFVRQWGVSKPPPLPTSGR